MRNIVFAAMLSALVLTACNGTGNVTTEEVTYHGDSIIVNTNSSILSKIQTLTVQNEQFSSEFRTVGTVQAENGRYAEVGLPFDGRVTRSFVRLGARVHAGQPLFEVSSPDFLEVSKDYFQSLRSYEKAKAEYDRKKELMNAGIASQREHDEAFTEAENAKRDMEFAEATLRVYGADPNNVKMGQPMNVVAPISGEVVANSVTVGAFTSADSDPLITIADLGSIWVTALVKERFIGSVAPGGIAEIISDAEPDKTIEGRIINVGNIVDEETRSIQVVICCNNKDLSLKHGMYVSVHFLGQAKESIVVPSTALFQGEEKNYVFACTDKDNVFTRVNVEIGSANDDNSRVSIVKGLSEGDKIISVGGLYLNN